MYTLAECWRGWHQNLVALQPLLVYLQLLRSILSHIAGEDVVVALYAPEKRDCFCRILCMRNIHHFVGL